MAEIRYRHNVMNINSIKTFLSIKGGFNNNVRDVYFIRAVGEISDLANIIADADRQMDIEVSKNRLVYKRFNSLPQIRDIADSNFYTALYLKYYENNKGKFRNIRSTETLESAVSEALNSTIRIYKESRSNLTSSMVRNFGTKLLFWLDQAMGDCLNDWSEKLCIKIIADNVVKEQEYLFYLFLTYIGCDVLLIENRNDIITDEKLLKYSYKFKLGGFGNTILKQYKRYIPEKVVDSAKNTAQQVQQPKVVIPERTNRRSTNLNGNSNINMNSLQRREQQVPKVQVNREKSYEELAQLASSVVLIAIHDSNGEIMGTGSGIMIGKKGYILTNNHVASGGCYYSVRIEDDEEVYTTNEVIKYNSVIDLAVIRIRRQLNPIPIYQGKKKLVRGQKVVAIGSPLGLFNSVSDGIISGFRNINDVDMIQFTAPISHGSSGGAVLNLQGEVIGISTAGIDSGQNINLAIGYENIKLFTNGFTN